jgi:hypothetical protein
VAVIDCDLQLAAVQVVRIQRLENELLWLDFCIESDRIFRRRGADSARPPPPPATCGAYIVLHACGAGGLLNTSLGTGGVEPREASRSRLHDVWMAVASCRCGVR